ncbi:hypothetical protein [Pannonibacter sp. P2PFMT1]|uniref:hypothetical protein n=1 Tax=Pannonibacter sp. P2PFMT1 TaxID=2003582 RepID=UPI001646BF65|nr:hypothetical protein [Pannonibacter sp. P2PFMT1]
MDSDARNHERAARNVLAAFEMALATVAAQASFDDAKELADTLQTILNATRNAAQIRGLSPLATREPA